MRIAGLMVLGAGLLATQAPHLQGTWQLQTQARDGSTRTTTYVFKVRGSAFTGTVANTQAISDIVNGAVDGTQITFDVPNGYQPAQPAAHWNGTLADDGTLTVARVVATPAGAAVNGAVAGRGGRGPTVLHKVSEDTVFHLPEGMEHPPVPAFQPLAGNGLAATPPMGWNSWNKFAGKVDDKTVRAVADAMVTSGMRDAGYVYVNIDDTWEGSRDPDGNILSNGKFPDMKALADYVHSKGLKLGIYSSPGPKTCAGYEGSYLHEAQDARTYAAWGVDYLKYDWCSATSVYRPADMPAVYEIMAKALRATGRPIVYSLCQYGWLDVGNWGAAAGGNLWRTTDDISDKWSVMADRGFNLQAGRAAAAGPGHWNDPDMLEIGNGGMSRIEYQTHMSLWSMLAAPLIAGNDIATMTPETKAILTNPEVIAIDQDKLGQEGACALQCNGKLAPGATPTPEIWIRHLAGGATAVGLFNRSDADASMSVAWADLGLKTPNKIRDLWNHQDVRAPQANYAADVPAHGVVLLRVE